MITDEARCMTTNQAPKNHTIKDEIAQYWPELTNWPRLCPFHLG